MNANSPEILQILPDMINEFISHPHSKLTDTEAAQLVENMTSFIEAEWPAVMTGLTREELHYKTISTLITPEFIYYIIANDYIETAIKLCLISEPAFNNAMKGNVYGRAPLNIAFEYNNYEIAAIITKALRPNDEPPILMAVDYAIKHPKNDTAFKIFNDLVHDNKTDQILNLLNTQTTKPTLSPIIQTV